MAAPVAAAVFLQRPGWCGAGGSRSQPPVYETRSSILIEASVPHVLGSAARSSSIRPPANFYMMVTTSCRRVAGVDQRLAVAAVATRLRLLSEPSFLPLPPPSADGAAEELLNHYTADLVAETWVLGDHRSSSPARGAKDRRRRR